jgi:transposase
MRFMITKGGVNAGVFIDFLKRLLSGATQKIFLIVDRGPAHRAKKTKAFVESLGGALRLFFLPPYSPDPNPDELVWNHLKTHTVGRTTTDSKHSFRGKVLSSRARSKTPQRKSPHSFKNHHSNMPRKCRHINELINTLLNTGQVIQMILPFPDRTNNALAHRIEGQLLARERGPMLFQLPEPAPEMPDPYQVFMVLYLCSPSVALCEQKSTDPKAFMLLKHFTGSAKNIAADVIELAL